MDRYTKGMMAAFSIIFYGMASGMGFCPYWYNFVDVSITALLSQRGTGLRLFQYWWRAEFAFIVMLPAIVALQCYGALFIAKAFKALVKKQS